MPVNTVDHYAIRTTQLEATREFYEQALGFEVGPRPPVKFPGYWLYREGKAIVHLIGVDPDDNEALTKYLGDMDVDSLNGTGAIDHIAFLATDAAELQDHLKAGAVPFRERTIPDLGIHQVFLEDPNGITIELNFALEA
jgi:catechol 2,3-dioxygenase-like lactoylglutathione lyase family enzyme